MENKGDIIIYQGDDGKSQIDVRLDHETLWLSLNKAAELFNRDKSVISRHIKDIFKEEELDQKSIVAFFATVQEEGRRQINREIEI